MPNLPDAQAGRLVLLHAADPEALLTHAAQPFCTSRAAARLPLLAVRQGGLRDELQARAARAGCPGWLGTPVVVFAELPELLGGDQAPLTRAERRTLLDALLATIPLAKLGGARAHRGFLDALDSLFGDLVAERVAPETLTLPGARDGAWETVRDADLRALYAAYLKAVAGLPLRDGVARSDGRDGRTLAAEAVRTRPDEVRRRLRRPLGGPDEPVTIAVYGLNDLRRGWDHLLDALLEAPFVDEVRVYLPLDHVVGDQAVAERASLEAIGEYDLLDALLARRPREVVRVPKAYPDGTSGELAALRGALFRTDAAVLPHTPTTPVAAVGAPDLTRELEAVARRVKRLIVDEGAAPHSIGVVSRKSRPYGPRAVEVLRRHGVPVTARLRTNLGEVPVVAALLRLFRAAAEGFAWRTLAELAESPYFDLALDVGLLRRVSTRGRYRTLDGWEQALGTLADEAGHAEQGGGDPDSYAGPDLARARRAVEGFAAFRGAVAEFTTPRTRDAWLALALRCIGRGAGGERPDGAREGLWGLARNACRLPHDETDALVVDATRRDVEALAALAGLLVDWRAALPLAAGTGDERLEPAAWYRELAAALDDAEVVLSTPHRRGVQVLEASAAVWRPFDHLFLVGLSSGEFPAEPSGRELFGEHEREARHAAGLPLDPARVWFAREASLLRTLVHSTRRSLHVSYAYADASAAAQIPSAYFDEVVSRFTASGAGSDRGRADAWVEHVAGSAVTPPALDDVWCGDDLHRFAARAWGREATRVDARAAFGHLAADGDRRELVERVLVAAGVDHARRLLRLAPPARRGDAARAWNGAVSSSDLLAVLDARFADATWSATQLEAYGRCPFTFFARHVLDLRADEEPAEEMDGATHGALVHVCLARLHERLASDFGDDALTSRVFPRAERVIRDVVRRALDEFERTGRGGVPALRAVRERELASLVDGYLRWEVAENEKPKSPSVPRRRPVATEVAFGVDGRPAAALHLDGRVLRLRGRIDRVDEILEGDARGTRYVVDHKTSAGSLEPVKLYEAGGILQLPLYLLALDRTAQRGGGVWGGAYQIAKDGKCGRTARLHPCAVKKDGKPTVAALEAQDRRDGALEHAFLHVDAIRRGEFPARIPECSTSGGCPPFCEMRDVCREDRPASGGFGR